MVERIVAHEEDLGQLLVVGHHGWAESLLCHHKEIVDVFDRVEHFLPQLKLDGGTELHEADVEMVLEDIGLR